MSMMEVERIHLTARMIQMANTSRIKGPKFIYDYNLNKIYMDAKNEVDIKDGTVNVDLPFHMI